MSKEIIQLGHPALREVCEPIDIASMKSPDIQGLISDMKEALASQSDGIGLSAPQIAVTKRMFIMSSKLFEDEPGAEDIICINPEILSTSKKTYTEEEGCLSIRGIYGDVERPESVEMTAYNEHGDILKYKAHGLLARVIQHEIDHLDGILFIDKATDIKEIPYEQ